MATKETSLPSPATSVMKKILSTKIAELIGSEQVQDTKLTEIAHWLLGYWLLGKKSLILSGSVGTGKTTIADAIYSYLTEKGRMAAKISASSLQRYIAEGKLNLQEIASVQGLLILDDVGVEDINYQSFGNRMDLFPNIVYTRYAKKLPTLITTNLNSAKMAEVYGERVADRLKTWDKIVLTGKSLRI